MWCPPWQALGAKLVDCALWGRTGSPAVLCTQGPPARLNAPLRACAPPRQTHLDVEVGRVEAAGRDQPCLGCPQVLGHQLSGSLHQELTVALGRHHPGDQYFRRGLPQRHQQPPPAPAGDHCACPEASQPRGAAALRSPLETPEKWIPFLGLLYGAPEPVIRVPGSSVRLGP